jgi:hypothetical protein
MRSKFAKPPKRGSFLIEKGASYVDTEIPAASAWVIFDHRIVTPYLK